MAVLTFEQVDVRLDKRAVLRDLNFTVEAGEIIGVLGANGAGKTSLLRAIGGELDCCGEIHLAGRPVRDWNLRERACHLAVLPQFSVLNFPYSVAEVVALGRVPHATGKGENQAVVDAVMALMDVTAIRHQLYTRLSGGEKRRVQLARVLAQIWCREESVNSNRVLLLDEPSAALDLLHRQSLLDVFEKLRQQGTAAIVVEHDLNFAARFADRLLALGEGGVVALGSPGQVITQAIIRRLYQVDATILPHPHSGQPVVIN